MLYAVGVFNLFEGDLSVELIKAENFKEALCKHSKIDWDILLDDIEEIKEELANQDVFADIKEINWELK